MKATFSCLAALIAASFFPTTITGQTVVSVNTLDDVRLVTEPNGARDDNNGGNTASGALIGLNTGGIDNFLVFDYSDLSAVQGATVLSATFNVDVNVGFSNGNHGTTADRIQLNEIAFPNVGWLGGTGVISGADSQADDGSISFLNRIQFDTSGTTEAWLDTAGLGVGDLFGAMTAVDDVAGWNQGGAPTTLSIDIPLAIAQSWADNGAIGGLALSTIDNGDSMSRYNFVNSNPGNDPASSITFTIEAVPEPSSIVLLGSIAMVGFLRRRKA